LGENEYLNKKLENEMKL